METQIVATLDLLSQSIKDKNVQVRGLKILLDASNESFPFFLGPKL